MLVLNPLSYFNIHFLFNFISNVLILLVFLIYPFLFFHLIVFFFLFLFC